MDNDIEYVSVKLKQAHDLLDIQENILNELFYYDMKNKQMAIVFQVHSCIHELLTVTNLTNDLICKQRKTLNGISEKKLKWI